MNNNENYNNHNRFTYKSDELNTSDDFSRSFSTENGINKNDANEINSRLGKNEPISPSSNVDDQQENSNLDDNNKIEDGNEGKNDNVKEKDSNKLEEEDDKTKDEKKDKDNSNKLKKEDETYFIKKIKKLFIRFKLYFIIGIASLVFFIIMLLFAIIASAIDSFTGAIANFFGIAEYENEQSGLYAEEKYIYKENGEDMTHEDLIQMLQEDNDCTRVSIFSRIGDFLTGNNIGDVCKLIRFIKSETEGKDIDKSLIISTIMNGYDAQPARKQYINSNDVPDDYIESSDHYDALVKILEDDSNFITKDIIKKIIESALIKPSEMYYEWVIQTNENSTTKTAKCLKHLNDKEKYSLDKWKVYMRFGEDASKRYQELYNYFDAKKRSSQQCNGSMDKNQLLELIKMDDTYKLDDASIEEMLDFFNKDYKESDLNLLLQYADVNSKTKDIFDNLDDIKLDYTNGFSYINFPLFKRAIEDSKINVEYNDIFTAKEIETIIQDTISRKEDLNSVLLLEDKN